jgi:hypothetical protein
VLSNSQPPVLGAQPPVLRALELAAMSWKADDSWKAASSWAPKGDPPYTASASSAGHVWDVAPDPADAQEESSTAWKGKGKTRQADGAAKGKGKKGKDATGKAAEDAKQGGKKRSAPEREPELTEDDITRVQPFPDPAEDSHMNFDEHRLRGLYAKYVMFPLKVDKRPEEQHRGYRRLVDHYTFEYSPAEHTYIQKDMHENVMSRSVRVAVPDAGAQVIDVNVKFPDNNNIDEVLSFHRVVPRAPTWVTVDKDLHGKRWLISAVIPAS